MKCPKCGAQVNPGATFCGSCGQPITAPAVPGANQIMSQPQAPAPAAMMPAMAGGAATVGIMSNASMPTAAPVGNTKALLSLLLAVVGLLGWLIPIAGLVLGIAAIVLATLSRHEPHKIFSTIGLILAIPVIGLSIFTWVHNIQQLGTGKNGGILPSEWATSNLALTDTPCFSASFPKDYKISNTSGSCSLTATNPAHTDIYTIAGLDAGAITDFKTKIDQAAQAEIKSLPGATLGTQKAVTFAGESAYSYDFTVHSATINEKGMVDYVLLPNASNNLFSIVRETNSSDGSLTNLEGNWVWK